VAAAVEERPAWAVCAELGMPVQSHSGWSPDYGDVGCATAMFISEVDMWAQRPFTALLWSGVFERHPELKYILTETGVGWVVEKLRVLEFKADNPIFKHFTKDLSLSPSGYFARQCYLGASFMPAHEGRFRHEIGVDRLMWGSDYPHLEGTWPDSRKALTETFHDFEESDIRAILGLNAAKVYGFDENALTAIAQEIGPSIAQITGFGQETIGHQCDVSSAVPRKPRVSPGIVARSARSVPAQKDPAVPVSTTTWASSSVPARSIVSMKSPSIL